MGRPPHNKQEILWPFEETKMDVGLGRGLLPVDGHIVPVSR